MTSSQKLKQFFLQIGKLEGYSYLLLLFIAMPLKYIFDLPGAVRVVGTLHGFLFVLFMLGLALLFLKKLCTFRQSVFAFLLSLIPFGTFYLPRVFNKSK